MADSLVDAVVELVERAVGRGVEPSFDAGGQIAEEQNATPAPQPPVLLMKGIEQMVGRLRARDLGREHLAARVLDQHRERVTPGGRDGGAAEAGRRRIAAELSNETTIEQAIPRSAPRRFEITGERFAQHTRRRRAKRRVERLDRERERLGLGPGLDREPAPELPAGRLEIDLVELEQELIESAGDRSSRTRATETFEEIDQLAPIPLGERGEGPLQRLFAQSLEQRVVERGNRGHAGEAELEPQRRGEPEKEAVERRDHDAIQGRADRAQRALGVAALELRPGRSRRPACAPRRPSPAAAASRVRTRPRISPELPA